MTRTDREKDGDPGPFTETVVRNTNVEHPPLGVLGEIDPRVKSKIRLLTSRDLILGPLELKSE